MMMQITNNETQFASYNTKASEKQMFRLANIDKRNKNSTL